VSHDVVDQDLLENAVVHKRQRNRQTCSVYIEDALYFRIKIYVKNATWNQTL